MQEDFIHYLWKFKKLSGLELKTTTGDSILIQSLGNHNHHSGPDFFNARLIIDNQEWAGNVEMHVKASDWYLHGHDDDPAYDNVILHVVWIYDAEITRRDEVPIPVLEVSQYVPENLIAGYRKLFSVKNGQFINCDGQFDLIDEFKKKQWFEKLFIERLQDRYEGILQRLERTNNDWEAVFFQMLCRGFGTKVNADAFEQMAYSMNQSTIRKLGRDAFQLEAALLGQVGMLDKDCQDKYFKDLCKEYAFAKAKYQLQPALTAMKLFRLRPANYPTIRISQLAQLYKRHPHLFAEVLIASSYKEIKEIFKVKAAVYWDTHHLFDKQVMEREKWLTDNFIDLIIINTVIPIKFAHNQYMSQDKAEELLQIMSEIKPEKNTIVSGFHKLTPIKSALESQAVLQLKPNYCDLNKCLKCDIGVSLVHR